MAITKKRAAARRRRARLRKSRGRGTKSIFKSKTAAANFGIAAAGLVAAVHPATAEFVKSHVAWILTGIGFLNLLLRAITHQRVTLFGSAR